MRKLAAILLIGLFVSLSSFCLAGGGGSPTMPPQDIPQDTIPETIVAEPTPEVDKDNTGLIIAIVTTSGTVLAALIGAMAIIISNKNKNNKMEKK
jgi:hypothetical protein